MKRTLFAMALAAALGCAPLPVVACDMNPTCTAGTFLTSSNTYVCDVQCFTATDCASARSFTSCDQCGTGAGNETPDGKCVICNIGNHAATINGTSGADVICGGTNSDVIDGKGGADIINAGGGNDTVTGGTGADELAGDQDNDTLLGGDQDDIVVDGSGNNYVDAGNGVDTIWTGSGDDEVHGGAGNDLIIGGGGSDYLDGGADNDAVSSIVYGQTSVPDDALGTRYCGGSGNDNLQARGPGHQCMDGGDGTDTCGYAYFVTTRTAGNLDVGTATRCESSPGITSTRTPPCACP
jgi:Ca2+-binding RTX toxin-like protein